MNPTPRSPTALVGLLHPAAGPILRAEIRAPSGEKRPGLVVIDTGASMSAIDRELARQLDLPSPGAARWRAITEDENDQLSALRSATLTFPPHRQAYALDLIEVPRLADRLEGFAIHALLGWDFLQHCTLTLDGPKGSFALELPVVRRRRR